MNGFSISRATFDRWLIYLAIGLVSLLFAACAPQTAAPTPAPTSSLAGTRWTLVLFGQPDAETPVLAGTTITIEFSAKGRASGSGGCNTYSAGYEMQGNRLSFGPIGSTKMACNQGGVGQQEQIFYNALRAAGRFDLSGDRLVIWYGDGQATLNWQRDK